MRSHARFLRTFLLGVAFAIITVMAGCGGDDDDNPVDPGPSPTHLTGVFANRTVSGTMTLTIQGPLAPARRSSSVPGTTTASAVLTPDLGTSASLAGTYASDTLNMSGGGYVLHGVYEEATSAVVGHYSGPSGDGRFICAAGGTGDVDTYCGIFGQTGTTYIGEWNLVIAGDRVHGIMAAGDQITFSGTVMDNATTRTIMVNKDTGFGSSFIAEGTLNTSTDIVAGMWVQNDTSGSPISDGTWSASACGQPPQTQLVGTFIGAGDGGRMSLSVEGEALARVRPASSLRANHWSATAVLTSDLLPYPTVAVPGYYSPETDTLVLGGAGYSLVGAYDTTAPVHAILGQYAGLSAGVFACVPGDTNTVKVFCGTYENEGQTASGRWNLILSGGQVFGVAVSTEEAISYFGGTAAGTGGTRTLTLTGDDGAGNTTTATGTLDLSTYTISNGTWQTMLNSAPADSGSWDARSCPGVQEPGGRDIPWTPTR